MKEKTSKNLQLSLCLTIICGILGFVSNKYFSEYLGMENLGLMRLFSQLVAYLSLADLGIGSAATYALYKPISEKNYEKLSLVVSTISSLYKKIAIFLLIIGLLLNFIVPILIKTEIKGFIIYIYWSLYVINTSISYTFAKYSILFTANHEYGFVKKISGLSLLFSQVIQIIVLIYAKSFLLYILINILNNLICFYFYKKHFKEQYQCIKKISKQDKNIVKDTKNMFCHKIGGLVVSNTDYIVLAKFTNLSVIAIYSSYLTVYAMIMTMIGIITSVITPVIGRFIASNKKGDIYVYWKNLYSLYMFLGTVFVLCTYKLITPFINLWLGETYMLSKFTVSLIMINLFISITRSVTDVFKDCSGFFEDTYMPIIESIINLSISLILVQKIGLDGVIIGTICSNIIVVYFLKPILVFKRCFDKTKIDYLKKLLGYIILVFLSKIVSEILIKLLNLEKEIKTWLEFVKMGTILSILILIVTLIIFMVDSNFRKYILRILKCDLN